MMLHILLLSICSVLARYDDIYGQSVQRQQCAEPMKTLVAEEKHLKLKSQELRTGPGNKVCP